MRRVCCVCGLVLDPGEGPDDKTSHGYCDTHYREAMAEIEAYKKVRADVRASARE